MAPTPPCVCHVAGSLALAHEAPPWCSSQGGVESGSNSGMVSSVCVAQVYNTGRSLDKWRSLIEEKRGILAPPDVLISSVGTKVSRHSPRALSRAQRGRIGLLGF